jgi:pyridoxine kinase
VLSGYQGAEEVGGVVLDTVTRVKELNPSAIYCCDPVMGDVGRGMFVRPGIPEFMRDQVVPAADVVTPNHFELDFLSGRETHTVSDVLDAVDAVRATGPSTVLVTSVLTDATPKGSVDVIAVSDEGAWSSRTPLLPITPNGCGDVTAAVFLAHLLRTGSAGTALQQVTSTVFGILEKTIEAGTREIQLVAAQDVIADPPRRFEPVRLR